MVGGHRKGFAKALRKLRTTQFWAAFAATTIALAGCGGQPPLTNGDTTIPDLTSPSLTSDGNGSVGGFTPADLRSTGFAVNVPQQTAFVPSIVRPERTGLRLINEFPQWPIIVQNGVLQSTVTGNGPENTGAVHFRHSLYDVYIGMAVQVLPGFANAMSIIMRHHVTPSSYGTRPHCYVACRINSAQNRLEVGEDIGGVWHLRGWRYIQSLQGTLEAIAYKSNYGCYFNGQFIGAAYSKQFQENNERNALYGVTGQAFRAARAVVVDLFEASKKTEIGWFQDDFNRNQFGSAGFGYLTPSGQAVTVANGMLQATSYGVGIPVWIEGTAEMRSQDIRAEVSVGSTGKAGVIGHYVPGRGGYAAFIDCNGPCAIRTGYINANNTFSEVQSVQFGSTEYPNIGWNFNGRAKLRMTVMRNQYGQVQINVYLDEQLALSFRTGYGWVNGHAGAYVMNTAGVDKLVLADHSQ